MESGSLVKASGAIHITHKINLVQKKLWNYLLKHAYNELLTKIIFSISMSEIYTLLGTRNDKNIKSLLQSFMATVAYNMFGKDNVNKWVRYELLPIVYIENGCLHYSFGEDFSKLLYKPQFYALINLAIQEKLSSKFSLFLYELCLDYKGIGKTGWITLDEFRSFMGINYAEFKDINKYVIKKAVTEINKLTDINIELKLKYLGRKVIEIQFLVRPKLQYENEIEAYVDLHDEVNYIEMPVVPDKQSFVPARVIDKSEDENLIISAMNVGVEEKAARQALVNYGQKMFSEKLNMLKARKDKIINKTGWFLNALKNDWRMPELNTPKTSLAKAQSEQRNRELLQKLKLEHDQFVIDSAIKAYEEASDDWKQQCDADIDAILAENKKTQYPMPNDQVRYGYLIDTFVDNDDTNFDLWVKAKKYELPKSI
jgi:plasmid replication initiation protein